MIDVADLDGAFVKSAVASGTALTLTVQNASDVEQTITFTPAGGGGAAASEETFVGTIGGLTGVVQATFDNLFTITETLDVGDVFAVSVSPSAITVPSDGRYLGCADVQIEQTTDAQANGRVVGVVRFSVTSNSVTTASPVEGSVYVRGNSGDLAYGSADVCAVLDLVAADTVELEFQAEIQNGAIDITAGNVLLTKIGGIRGATGADGTAGPMARPAPLGLTGLRVPPARTAPPARLAWTGPPGLLGPTALTGMTERTEHQAHQARRGPMGRTAPPERPARMAWTAPQGRLGPTARTEPTVPRA